jgi:putative membrane protein
MKFARFILAIVLNTFILWFCSQIISGFIINQNPLNILFLALILTILNFIISPLLKLIFSPLIVLTLGLGILIVNGIILYLLDFLFKSITIQSISALFYSTLIFSGLNFILHKAIQSKK